MSLHLEPDITFLNAIFAILFIGMYGIDHTPINIQLSVSVLCRSLSLFSQSLGEFMMALVSGVCFCFDTTKFKIVL